MKERGNFSGGLGFVLAAAGSAVGLGNLWRFPYLVAQHGGGIFILIYIIVAVTFGFSLLMSQIAIGRKTGVSQVKGYEMLNKKFKALGWFEWLVPVIILPYYCVIGGWVIKYAVIYIMGTGKAAAGDSYFGDFIGSTVAPYVFFLIYIGLTACIVLAGVKNGIEKISTFLMPLLVIMMVGMVIYVLSMDDATAGLRYYLVPDFSKFSIKTVFAAMGQLFFSMSIAMGIMVSYGSYTKKEVNLQKSVTQIELFDTVVALLAGLLLIPAVYAFSGEEGLKSGGAGLMFITLPKVFAEMPGGQVFGIVFFILVLFAALTSSISVLEASTSGLVDGFNMSRKKAIAIIMVVSVILGIPASLGNGVWSHITILGMDFLTFFDFLSNSVMMPIVAIGVCILVGWVIKPETIIEEATINGEKFGRKKIFVAMMKYIAPICLVGILLFYVLAQFGIITV